MLTRTYNLIAGSVFQLLNSFIKYFAVCLFLLTTASSSVAQKVSAGKPIVGDTCPGFILKEVHYYTSKSASLNTFRGKPLILDFFSVGCVSCFKSFPHVNELYEEYKDRMQYMLVGLDDKYIRSSFENGHQ